MIDPISTLKGLDPAPREPTSRTARSTQDLERIIAMPVPGDAGRPRTSRIRRLAVATLAASALVGAGLLGPGIVGGGDTAFATWTPAPHSLSATEAVEAGDGCREAVKDAGPMPFATRVAVADRRGAWRTVLLSGPDGYSALCISDTSAGWFSGDMLGSSGVPAGSTSPGPRELIASDLGSGSIGPSAVSLVAGYAGSDVVGVRFDRGTGESVRATVARGRFVLWFPGDTWRDVRSVLVQVTLDDGTARTERLSLRR